MGCQDKLRDTCGQKQYSSCVYYELEIPEFSELFEESCITIEDTTEDLYTLVGEIKDELDLSTFTNECLTLSGTPTLFEVLSALQTEICALKAAKEETDTLIQTMQAQIVDLQNNTCP